MSTPYHTVIWNAQSAQPKDGERVLAFFKDHPDVSGTWRTVTFYDANGGRWFLDGMIEIHTPVIEWMQLPEETK